MARIEGFRIKNYRVLKDITLGKLWNTPDTQPLTPMTAVIGKNGVGKSSLFDAFGFLSDCLKLGVEEACDARGRGGFERIRSQGKATRQSSLKFYYRGWSRARPITYELAIDLDDENRPYVAHEILHQFHGGQKRAIRLLFLAMFQGEGVCMAGGKRKAGKWVRKVLGLTSSNSSSQAKRARDRSTLNWKTRVDWAWQRSDP